MYANSEGGICTPSSAVLLWYGVEQLPPGLSARGLRQYPDPLELAGLQPARDHAALSAQRALVSARWGGDEPGLVAAVTIIGIPFGIQHLKLALIALAPIGMQVVPSRP